MKLKLGHKKTKLIIIYLLPTFCKIQLIIQWKSQFSYYLNAFFTFFWSYLYVPFFIPNSEMLSIIINAWAPKIYEVANRRSHRNIVVRFLGNSGCFPRNNLYTRGRVFISNWGIFHTLWKNMVFNTLLFTLLVKTLLTTFEIKYTTFFKLLLFFLCSVGIKLFTYL